MPSPADADEMSIRLDDGQPAMCLPDERIVPGDRVYRVLYAGRPLKRRAGVEIHDVTADVVQQSCALATMRTSYVYAGMAAVPAMLLCLLVAARTTGGRGSISTIAMGVTILSLAIPLALWAMQARLTRRDNGRRRTALDACRLMVAEVIAGDVEAWKERLDDAIPGVPAPTAGLFVRGTACRMVEGTCSTGTGTARIVRRGRPIEIPPEAMRVCGLDDEDLVHALIPAGRVPAVPLAVSSPARGLIWTDDAIAGGRDGTVYRATMRAALGRAAWDLVTRQWDEIGKRRRIGSRP
jgi:hypothetical protein